MNEQIKTIKQALQFIESNLNEDLNFEEIAKHVNLSAWHFQRNFKALTGDTLKEYIRGRRLALAADKLINTEERILDIAIAAGFESQESFTRSFIQYFGKTPNVFRKHKNSSFLIPAKTKFDDFYIELINQGEIMEPKIRIIPAKKLIGMTAAIKCPLDNFKNGDTVVNPESYKKYSELWDRFLKRINEIDGVKKNVTYAVSDLLPTDLEKDDEITNTYFACAEVEDFTNLPNGMRAIYLPETKYAVFKCPLNDTSNTIRYILTSWLPKSDFTRLKLPEIEIYDENFDTNSENPIFEYAVPIV